MNILKTLFGIFSIILHVRKISGGEAVAIRYRDVGPLALIQEVNPSELKLGIPQKVIDDNKVALYSYDDTGEHGRKQEFKVACPAYTNQQMNIEIEWRKTTNASQESTLFFLQEYTGEKMICETSKRTGPSIQKRYVECGKSQGEIYEVGYSVQLMEIYKICYSKDKSEGIIYTTHRIDSPSLMLLRTHDEYEPSVLWSFKSHLDEKLHKVKKSYKNQYIYQFVPRYDMPTILWENTTLFPFNYTSVGGVENKVIFKNMMKYDNVVRLFSKQTSKPLTVYSGTYQTTITEECTKYCFLKSTTTVQIKSFWRIIMDDENNATILITQHTRKTCGEKTAYMCNEDFVLLEDYRGGGCTYKCSLNDDIIDLLRLPQSELTIKGNLDIRYTTELKSESTPQNTAGQSDTDAQSSTTQVDISDFGNASTFAAAVATADVAYITGVQAGNAFNDNGGSAYVGGGGGAFDVGGGGGLYAEEGGVFDVGGGGGFDVGGGFSI